MWYEVKFAKDLGIDFIVTDHHEPQNQLPDCFAVVNPKCSRQEYPFRNLAGVGVVFKLGQALVQKKIINEDTLWENIDIVALGTIADIVPLKDENRILVKIGLEKLNNSNNLGIKSLIEESHLKGQRLNTIHVGYILAPKINATGRLGDPSMGVKLLIAANAEEAKVLAKKLTILNEKRQAIEAEVLQEVKINIEKNPEFKNKNCWVFANEGWHIGVIGIVASKLMEEYYRPIILISLEGEQGRGSGRSIPGFHLFKALQECKDLFITFGGHELAAGLTISRNNIYKLQEMLNKIAEERLSEENLIPSLYLEEEITLEELSLGLLGEISLLEPYGAENPKPLLLCRDTNLLDYQLVGENGKHLKLKVKDIKAELEGIGFNMGAWSAELATASALDLVFTVEENNWQGKKTVQMNLKDIKVEH